MSYKKNIWKNFINANSPGTFITAEKMNNIENGIELIDKEIEFVKLGAMPTANTPILSTAIADIRASSIYIHVTGISVEDHLELALVVNKTTTHPLTINIDKRSVNDKKFRATATVTHSNVKLSAGEKLVVFVKNKYDSQESNRLTITIPKEYTAL